MVKAGIDRGAGFVKQILRFAANEPYTPGPVDLNRVVDDLRPILARRVGSDVELTVEQEPDLPPLYADPVQVEQVLLNLVVNASEAMSAGGHLGIRTEHVSLEQPLAAEGATLPPGSYLLLTVTDTGYGIPHSVRGRIFEPFFSTKEVRSSGFGLSTVDRSVRGLGGAVTVDSVQQKGTAFRVYLPIRTAAPALPEVLEPTAGVPLRGRVLVVEDDPAVRSVTLRILSREGFAVMGVGAAREALQVFDRVRPEFDLVVCDVSLPDRSGPELIRILRNRVEALPVLYVSSYDREKVPDHTEAVSFLEKPFTPQDLAVAVTNALASARRRSPASGGAQGG